LVGGKKVILGVAFDSTDMEMGYYVLGAGLDGSKDEHYTYYPCYDNSTGRFVSALVCRPGSRFPGQARGFPWLLASLFGINAIDKLSEFTIVEACTKSLLGIAITTDSAQGPQSVGAKVFNAAKNNIEGEGEPEKKEEPNVNMSQLEAGDIPVLPPGSKIETFNNGGNLDIVAGIKAQIKLIAGSLGIPSHILMRDFDGINFSAGKLEIDALFRLFDLWNYGPIMRVFGEIYKWVVIEYWLLQGKIPTSEYWASDWIGPGAPDPDPLKSAHADTVRLGNGTVARSSIAGKRGDDYEQTLEQIKADGEAEERILGRKFQVAQPAGEPKTLGSASTDVEDENEV